jgi:hypothetical protein
MNNNNLSVISLSDLNTVTGGTGSSSTKQSAAIEQSLAGIKTSLADLGSKKKEGGMDSTTMMCLGLMMANKNKQQSNNTVVAGNGTVASTWSWG